MKHANLRADFSRSQGPFSGDAHAPRSSKLARHIQQAHQAYECARPIPSYKAMSDGNKNTRTADSGTDMRTAMARRRFTRFA